MTETVVRLATLDDDRSLAQLDASEWPTEVQVVPPRPADVPFFRKGRSVEDVIVAVNDGVVVGFAHVDRHIPVPANAHV